MIHFQAVRLPKGAGFTLIESLIALLVLSVALLGMAAVMAKASLMAGQRERIEQAIKLSKGRLSQLGHVEFNLIGTGTDQASKLLYGAPNQEVVTEGPLNYQGLDSTVSSVGPFLFRRSLVVCKDDADGGSNANAASGASPCGDVTTSRPQELSCDISKTTAGQVLVRVMTAFRDSSGGCHKVAFDQVLVNFQ